MKRLPALLLFGFAAVCCKAQALKDSVPVEITSVPGDSSLLPGTWLFIDSSASLSASEVLQKDFFPLREFREEEKYRQEWSLIIFS